MKRSMSTGRISPGPLLGWIAAVIVMLLGGPGAALAQCALCRDAVAASSAETREAMNYAILGLAFAPYGVAAVAALALSPSVRAYVRARVKRLIVRNTGEQS